MSWMTKHSGTRVEGGGGKFSALRAKLAGEPGIRNPGGLAASIGFKKYGKSKMEAMSKKGEAESARENAGEKGEE